MVDAITLLSGGPDSSTLAFHAKHELGLDQVCLFVDSGQLFADQELAAARVVSAALGAPLEIARLSSFRDLMLGFVPPPYVAMGGDAELLKRGGAFLPLAVACSYAVFRGADKILIATIAEDVEKFPAMIPFVDNFKPNFRLFRDNEQADIVLPLAKMYKREVLQLGHRLGVPLDATRTCQQPTLDHCGSCHRCLQRMKAFADAGINDSTRYGGTE